MKEFLKQFDSTTIIPMVLIISILVARFSTGHLLFHTLAELFTILVGVAMAIVIFYTYNFTKNNFLLYLGIGYFWIAVLDLFHMLTFKGMMIYPIDNSNVTLTFWILARFFEALLLLSAPFINFSTISKTNFFLLFGLISGSIYLLAFSIYAPALFVEGIGLTPLKIGSEYLIIILLTVALIIYNKQKENFDINVYKYVISSIIFTILAEFSFTLYIDFYGYSSVLGHLFKFLSYWMIFLAIVHTSLKKPFTLMAHESSTYEAIPVPAVVVDQDGTIRQINHVTENFLNLTKNEILNQSNHTLFHDKSVKESECKICNAIKNGYKLSSYELYRDPKTYIFTISPIHLANESTGAIQVCIDISEQKDIEHKLSSERSLLKTILNTVPIRIFWKDKESRYLGCNKLFAHDANLSSEKEVIGKYDYEMPWKQEAKLYVLDDSNIMKSKKNKINYEEPQTDEDGITTWLNTSKVPLINDEGEVKGILGAYFDITDKKTAEDTLHESQQHLEAIFKYEPESVELIGLDGRIIDMNPAGLEMLQADTLQEAQKQLLAEYILPEWRAHFTTLHKDVTTTGNSGILEFEIKGLKGKQLWLETHAVPMHDANGNITMLLGITRDITQRKESEHELNILHTAINQAPISIVITDVKGNLKYVNPFFTNLTGYKEEEILGKSQRLLASGLTTKDEYAKLWNKINNNETWRGIFKNNKKNGEEYWESTIISPIIDKDGSIVNFIGIKQDISEKIALESMLRDQEELIIVQSRHAAMGEMIGMIAHQWRQPLSVISMGANNMLLDIELDKIEPSIFEDEANVIIEQVNHLSSTIDDFRNFFRPDKEKESIAVKDVIDATLTIIGKNLESCGIEVNLEFSSAPLIETYKRELIQVLINIINNAKEAMNENSIENKKLSIYVKDTTNNVTIEICDNGGGIDNDIINKIFEPYFTTKNKLTGTGLGLYMSKTIVEKHLNGKITAINKRGGACFIITIYNNLLKKERENQYE